MSNHLLRHALIESIHIMEKEYDKGPEGAWTGAITGSVAGFCYGGPLGAIAGLVLGAAAGIKTQEAVKKDI